MRRRSPSAASDAGGRAEPRAGVALIAALAALVVLGAVITGIFLAALQDARVAQLAADRARSLAAAEFGLNAVAAPGGWNVAWRDAPVGEVALRIFDLGGGAIDSVRVIKTAPRTFVLLSTAGVGVTARRRALRRLGALVVLDTAGAPRPARARAWVQVQ